MPLEPAKYAALAAEGRLPEAAQVAIKNLIRVSLSKPQGVRGRNSDNSRLRQTLGWEPSVLLEEGLNVTYRWIENELRHAGRLPNIYTARSAD